MLGGTISPALTHPCNRHHKDYGSVVRIVGSHLRSHTVSIERKGECRKIPQWSDTGKLTTVVKMNIIIWRV